jgi:hypothetical protein
MLTGLCIAGSCGRIQPEAVIALMFFDDCFWPIAPAETRCQRAIARASRILLAGSLGAT